MTLKKNPGLAYYKEGANKTAPNFTNVAGTRLRLLREVSENFNTNLKREASNEVRNDAQPSGSSIAGAEATGTLNLQYSLDTYDDFLVGILYAANDAGTGREHGWRQASFTPLAAILASPASVTFDVSDDSLNGTFARAPAAGERIYVRGFGNKNLDTIFVVASGATTSKIPLENDTGAADVATYAGIAANVTGAAVSITPVAGYTRNGTYERKFGMVRMYSDTDLAGTASTSGLNACDWALFRGGIASGVQLAVAPGQAGWTGSISMILADEAIITDATSAANLGGFQITNWDELEVLNTNPLANAIQSVLMVRLRKVGAAVTEATRVDPQSFNINIGNGAAGIELTRNLGAVEINQGTYAVTVGLALLYIDPTYHQAMLSDEAYEIEIAVGDADGRAQLWRFPKGRMTSERPNPGKNAPIIQNLSFTFEPGGQGYVGAATAGRVVEILSFYQRAA